MAIDLAQFLQPVSQEEPCGPDLDLTGDMEFMNYIARAEGLLPATFFSFDRSSIDFNKEFATIAELIERTHDLRLLVLYAKLCILNRDLPGFAATLETAAAALEQFWDDVHPRAEDGDFILRVAVLQSLDDLPHVILPLQSAPLVDNRRYGAVTYRGLQVALGKVQPREGESPMELSTIERILLETDLDLIVAKRTEMLGLVEAAKRIQATSIALGGYASQVSLEGLVAVAEKIAEFLDQHVAGRDPAQALVPVEPAETAADDGTEGLDAGAPASDSKLPTTLADRREAVRALRAARHYFERFEPSSPSLLLIQYAENLMGKPFYDVVRILMPDFVSRAAIFVGQNSLKLGVGQISDNLHSSSYSDGNEPETEGADEEPLAVPQSRRDAMRLLDLVVTFFRQSEPASPIPLLIGRAREIGERDFVNLLKDLFSDSVLRSIKGDDGY